MNKESNWYKNKKGYNSEYTRTHYERINLTVPIGTKEKYYSIAKNLNVSVSQFFLMCAEEYIKDNGLEGDEQTCSMQSSGV